MIQNVLYTQVILNFKIIDMATELKKYNVIYNVPYNSENNCIFFMSHWFR